MDNVQDGGQRSPSPPPLCPTCKSPARLAIPGLLDAASGKRYRVYQCDACQHVIWED